MRSGRSWMGLCMLLWVLWGCAAAQAEGMTGETITVGEWTVQPIFCAETACTQAEHNALRVIGYSGQAERIEIPDALEVVTREGAQAALLPVVEIGENAFRDNEQLTEVVLGNGIRTVGAGAFYRCRALERVHLSECLEVLERDVFFGCESLREIGWPQALREIGSGCFEQCGALERAEIPEGVWYIGEGAFENCVRLSEVVLPRRVEYVGGHAFLNTPWLDAQTGEYVMAGDGVLLICRTQAERVVLSENVKMISSAFEGNDVLKQIVLPQSLGAIGEYAFAGCTALEQAEIPEGVRAIGAHAFEDCTALEGIRTNGRLRIIGEYAFRNCAALVRVEWADGLNDLGRGAFAECAALRQIELPQGLLQLKEYVFRGCVSLEEVTIPPSVQSVNEEAFGSGQDIWIRAVYDSAGERFARAQGLSCGFLRQQNEDYIYLRTPQGIEILQYIGRAAVLEMPDELDGVPITSIGEGAFQQAQSLRAVTLSAGITSLSDWAFAELYRLEQVMLNAGLTRLGDHAFSGCSALREIYLPQGLKQLSEGTFEGCERLTVLADADSDSFRLAQEIGLKTVDILTEYDAFRYEKRSDETQGDVLALCGYVMDERTLSLPVRYTGRAVTAVGTGAFGTGQWTIEVPEGYTALESGAFEDCDELDITLPRSVTQIAEDALRDCEQVTIRGYVGSTAEEYARRIGCRFIVRHDW